MNGTQVCANQECPVLSCSKPVWKDDNCCPTCEKETCYDDESGNTYKEGKNRLFVILNHISADNIVEKETLVIF